MHQPRLQLSYGERGRKYFHANGVSIEVEDSFRVKGGSRLVERGRGYVKVLVLYDEELRWLQEICQKEPKRPGGYQQLGRIKGGARTLLCTRIIVGATRKLELRLFAPYGKRQMCIPELVAGHGWLFFVELLSNFIGRFEADSVIQPFTFPGRLNEETNHSLGWNKQGDTSRMPKSYLQTAGLPKWHVSSLRSSIITGKDKCVLVDPDDTVENSF